MHNVPAPCENVEHRDANEWDKHNERNLNSVSTLHPGMFLARLDAAIVQRWGPEHLERPDGRVQETMMIDVHCTDGGLWFKVAKTHVAITSFRVENFP